MKTSLNHLSDTRRTQIEKITKIICDAVHPEKIILIGMYAGSSWIPGVDGDCVLPAFTSSYDILVISRPGDPQHDYEIQDIVENRCRFQTPVTVLVHDIDYVNRRISEGQYFFFMTCKEAVLLFDAGTSVFTDGPPPKWGQIKATARQDFDKFWPQANVFYKNALFTLEQKELKIAVFLLHQAAEQAYQAILLVFTGYKPCTHNLDKLRRYTVRLSIELAALFPRNTPEEDQLFRLLLESYVGARYRTEYSITPKQVKEISERVRQLLSIAERICKNQFIILNKLEAGSFAPAD